MSRSNGSGKSSLAMAALWGLTGSMDPRRVQDSKVADIVNDESKVSYLLPVAPMHAMIGIILRP